MEKSFYPCYEIMPTNKSTFRLYPAFVFMFKDDFWFSKVFLGGLAVVLCSVFIGLFLLLGYLSELMNGILHDNETPPEWRHSGRFFVHGIRLTVILTAYSLPFIVIYFLFNATFILNVIIILFLIIAPVVITQYALRFSIRDCFDWRAISSFILRNPVLFFLKLSVSYGTLTLSLSLGWMILIIGWPFAIFWAMLVQAYMLSTLRKKTI